MQPFTITMLNAAGDETYTWDKSSQKEAIAFIEKKMKEGHVFFEIKPRLYGLLKDKKIEVTHPKRLTGQEVFTHSNLAKVKDPDAQALINTGQFHVVGLDRTAPMALGERITKPEKVARSHTAAISPIHGG